MNNIIILVETTIHGWFGCNIAADIPWLFWTMWVYIYIYIRWNTNRDHLLSLHFGRIWEKRFSTYFYPILSSTIHEWCESSSNFCESSSYDTYESSRGSVPPGQARRRHGRPGKPGLANSHRHEHNIITCIYDKYWSIHGTHAYIYIYIYIYYYYG